MTTATISNISTRTLYSLDLTNRCGISLIFDPHADRQVREDKGIYIPELLSDAEYDAERSRRSAHIGRGTICGCCTGVNVVVKGMLSVL